MLTYDLSQRGDESLYEYLYLCIRADIETGVIPAGRRLPSKRSLAKHLGVSLITVEGAYAQLLAEGYAYSEERRGYFASAIDTGGAGERGVGAQTGWRQAGSGRLQGAFGCVGFAGSRPAAPGGTSAGLKFAASGGASGSPQVVCQTAALSGAQAEYYSATLSGAQSATPGDASGGPLAARQTSVMPSSQSAVSGGISAGPQFAAPCGVSSDLQVACQAAALSSSQFAAPVGALSGPQAAAPGGASGGPQPAACGGTSAGSQAEYRSAAASGSQTTMNIGASVASRPAAPLIASFAAGSLPPSRFPFAAWSRSVREVLSREPEAALLGDTSPQGSPVLREQLADYLRTFRGMRVHPDQIVVAAGSQVLYNLIVQLLGRNLGYAVETPGYPRLTSIYRANDVALSHIPLDASGLSVDALRQSGASVAHVMPSHQFPTGLVTPISRRYELLGWASERPGRYIVEDDYDCEFRLSGRPIPALCSIDATSCVIYTNTFAKSLGSAFRMAYMVLPEALLGRFAERLGFYSSTVSVTEQLALARFMASGEYERHVARTRTYYRGIRNNLVDALQSSEIANKLEVEMTDAGLHFLMRVHAGCSEAAIAATARARGVELSPLSAYRAAQPTTPFGAPAPGAPAPGAPAPSAVPTFVMNYSGLTPEQIVPAVQALSLALRDLPSA